jgi:hypothetical protein
VTPLRGGASLKLRDFVNFVNFVAFVFHDAR